MKQQSLLAGLFLLTATLTAYPHQTDFTVLNPGTNSATEMPMVPQKTGPVKNPPKATSAAISGQCYWTFEAAADKVPTPPEIKDYLIGAHGTIIVDTERDMAYWGLQGVGWIAFSNNLSQSSVVHGDPAFTHGNIHGADIFFRRGKLPLVAAADNVGGHVYVTDTSFQKAETLDWPNGGAYTKKSEYHPTDVAFTGSKQIYVTDGYGKAYVMPLSTDPLKYEGTMMGGKALSNTPHGITWLASEKELLISARPEGLIKQYNPRKQQWKETLALPKGSTVCDVDVWENYALAPCLDGPNKAPGPIYIIDLKSKTIVSTIRPKEDLGFTKAQHIHDAAWYVTGKGSKREVYIIFTNWSPGGIGALRLVHADPQLRAAR